MTRSRRGRRADRPLLFPLDLRFGGWSHVWWWHHYYVTFTCLLALGAAGLLALGERLRPRVVAWRALQAAAGLVAVALVARYFAIARFDASGTWHQNDARAIAMQAEWLPAPVHAALRAASDALPSHF
jgi:hypothetical protein